MKKLMIISVLLLFPMLLPTTCFAGSWGQAAAKGFIKGLSGSSSSDYYAEILRYERRKARAAERQAIVMEEQLRAEQWREMERDRRRQNRILDSYR